MVEEMLAARGICVSTKPCANGHKFGRRFQSDPPRAPARGDNGISMKSSSPSPAKLTGSGVRSISTALSRRFDPESGRPPAAQRL